MTELRPETLVVSAGRPAEAPGAPLAQPVSFSSNYHHGGAYAYGRTGNPTWLAFEEALAVLEGGEAVLFASGMAAATTLLETLPVGVRVVGPTSGYFEMRAFLADRGDAGRFDAELVDLTDTEATLAACRGAVLLRG